MGPSKERPNQNSRRRDPTRRAMGRFFFVLGFSVLIAGIGPLGHFAEVLSTFLLFCAAISLLGALLEREKLVAGYLTNWDVSAALIGIGLLARFVARL